MCESHRRKAVRKYSEMFDVLADSDERIRGSGENILKTVHCSGGKYPQDCLPICLDKRREEGTACVQCLREGRLLHQAITRINQTEGVGNRSTSCSSSLGRTATGMNDAALRRVRFQLHPQRTDHLEDRSLDFDHRIGTCLPWRGIPYVLFSQATGPIARMSTMVSHCQDQYSFLFNRVD